MLLLGVSGVLQDNPTFEMATDNREADFEILVSSQDDTGWPQLLKGPFSFHWAQIQQMHIDKSHDICSKTSSGDSWLKQVLHHVWLHLHLGWKLHNADLHGIDKADQET
jgi:hypothetical protein